MASKSKTTTAARTATVSKRSSPVTPVATKIIKNARPSPTPPASPSKAIDPNDCTLQHTELDASTGKVALAVRGGGATTWHGYGNEITDGMSMKEIQKAGGIDYTVAASPVMFYGTDGKLYELKDSRVTFRTDTHRGFGVVGKNYKIVQNSEIMDFFRDFCQKNKLAMETVGALRGGDTVWAMAKLGKDYKFMLPGNDMIDSYLRLQTSFGGVKRATDAVATTTRQVCKNTEEMINAQGGAYKVGHTTQFDAKALQSALGLLGEQYKVTAEFWNALVKRKVNDAERDLYFCKLFGIESVKARDAVDKDGKPEVSGRTKNMLIELADAFDHGPGADLKSAKGTAYGLLQAVTYWTDHVAVANDVHKDGQDNARLSSAWFGLGSRTKADAQLYAAELAGCEELIAA